MITVVRLRDLKDQKALSAILQTEIKPASTVKDGSSWVCQRLQKPGFWDDAMIGRMAKLDVDGQTMVWVALDGTVPVGICMRHVNGEDRTLALFVVSLAYPLAEQYAIADLIALAGLKAGISEGCKLITGYWPRDGFAGDYARRVGMKGEIQGKPMKIDPNPMLHWEMDAKEMQAKILSSQKVADSG